MSRQIQKATTLYSSFREASPKELIKLKVDIPRVCAAIGHVEAIAYRTTHGSKVELYRHDFAKGSRPLLCSSPDGKQLLLLGGRYQFTDRGIVDKDRTGKLIYNPKHGASINPRKGKPVRAPAHICPICNKAGGSHCPDSLHFLRLPGEYAHPRCILKASAKVTGTAPVRAHTHKKVFYFESHADAKEYAIAHGFPIDRIIPYQRGWAIQLRKSGPYVGNPMKRNPASKRALAHYAGVEHCARMEKALEEIYRLQDHAYEDRDFGQKVGLIARNALTGRRSRQNPALPKAARELALRHKINLGRDAHGNYFIRAGGKVVATTASDRPVASHALALVKKYLRS